MEFKKVNDPMSEELLLNCIRDSEIMNENNWTNKDIMRAFNLDMVRNNYHFQSAGILQKQRDQVAESIFNELRHILVKRNVSKNEFDIHSAVRDIKGVLTPRIISYTPGPYPTPYAMSYQQEKRIKVAGACLTEANRSNILIMDRIGGQDLASIYGEEDDDTPPEMHARCREIIRILRDNDILYSDITSYNFMLDEHDELWIIDFGHAVRGSYFIQEFLDGHNGWNPDFR